MHIDETIQFQSVWESPLEYENPHDEQVRGGTRLPVLSIGKPLWWDAPSVVGKQWSPPSGNNKYGLARFVFSLRPGEHEVIEEAELIIRLVVTGTQLKPTAFDLIPKTLTDAETGKRTLAVDPKLKLANVAELSGVKYETTIDLDRPVPVVSADGIGESQVRWTFRSSKKHLIMGSQITFITVEIPAMATALLTEINIRSTIQHRFLGPLRGVAARSRQERLRFRLC